MQFTRGAAVLAAAALLTGGLIACGEDEPTEPTTTASPISVDTSLSTSSALSSSSSSDGSATNGAGIAPLPEAAKKQTKEGAIAFNKFFWTQMGEALQSGDPASIKAYSDGCPVCDNVASGVTRDAKTGIHMDKNPYRATDASGRKRTDSGYRVELLVNIASYSEVRTDGSKGRTAKAGKFTTVSNTQWHDGHWVIKDMVRTK